MSEVELISGSPKDGRDHRNGHSMRARLTIQLSALLGDQAAGRCTVNTTSRPAGPIYLITAIDQAVQARTSSSQNFEGMLKPAVRRPGRDGPPRPREERRRGAAARRGVLECVLQTLWSAARRPGRGTGLNGHTHRRAAVRSRAQHAGLSLLVTTIGSDVLINSKEDAFDLQALVLDELHMLSDGLRRPVSSEPTDARRPCLP